MNKTVISDLFCKAKYIDHKHIKMYAWVNLSVPTYDAWVHTVYYYRFNKLTYAKFPIDLWENACNWLAKSSKSYILDWTMGVGEATSIYQYESHVPIRWTNLSKS